MMQIKNVK